MVGVRHGIMLGNLLPFSHEETTTFIGMLRKGVNKDFIIYGFGDREHLNRAGDFVIQKLLDLRVWAA